MIAKIAVSAAPFAIDKPYSYAVPAGMELVPGLRVTVPFGRANKRCEGVVLSLEEGSSENLKTVEARLEEAPLVGSTMLRLAAFLRERYFCTFYDCLRTMLPTGVWFREKNTYRLTEDRSWETAACRQKDALAILRFLRDAGGEAEISALRTLPLSEEALQAAISYLRRKKWVTGKSEFQRSLGDRTEKIATLAVTSEEALEYAAGRPKSAALQRGVLETICAVGSVSVKELCYYTGASLATVRRLAELGYLELTERPVLRCREIKPAQISGELTLNDEQQAALEGLEAQMHQTVPGAALLYGVTGSGKTAVYLKLIRSCLDSGKAAMLLVPEIGLTPQLLSLLAAYFGDLVAVQHSSLSMAERYDQWRRIQSGTARVIVGTRSAVFAPSSLLGLIIVDEEQEHSYKSENSPRYDAREVALWRGVKEKALVLFGSATPAVQTMYHAKKGDYRLYCLHRRFNGKPLPKVQLVDMNEEVRRGNDLSVSAALLEAMADARRNGKQTILFLNRRGNSRAMVCVDCGAAPECPRCSARLTYHSANERLMCHYCGFSQKTVFRCPDCGGPLKPIGTGTQKVQQELLNIYPDLTVDRMDTDTVNAVNTHEKILEHFQKEKVSVLLGTQMVAKGLNLPEVTLVGVLDADLSLYSGSYRAAETTFNMLTQVVGRAGRGDTAGQAMIQTMVPGHPVIQLASRQDYDGFYELEIGLRRVQNAPPFADIACVTFTGMEEARALRGAEKFRESLIACLKMPDCRQEACQVLGPAPCAVAKINYHYRYRLTLRCRMSKNLRALLAHLLRQFALDKANRGTSAFADVNGLED